jgi:hypothetical protein
MVRAKYTAPTRYYEAITITLVLRPFNISIHATKAMSFSLALENVELFITDKTDNGDSVLSEVKPFDRDQLVEHEERCSDPQEIIMCVFYNMGIAGHALALVGALRLVDHACELDVVSSGRNIDCKSTAPRYKFSKKSVEMSVTWNLQCSWTTLLHHAVLVQISEAVNHTSMANASRALAGRVTPMMIGMTSPDLHAASLTTADDRNIAAGLHPLAP